MSRRRPKAPVPSKEAIKRKADEAEATSKGETPDSGGPSILDKEEMERTTIMGARDRLMGKSIIGRPEKYTPALGSKVCTMIADGVPLVAICAMPGMPGQTTVYKWKREIDDFAQNYARARTERADARMEKIDELNWMVENGLMRADAAKAIIDSIKWQMGKEQPKKYGDFGKVAVTDEHGGKIIVEFSS